MRFQRKMECTKQACSYFLKICDLTLPIMTVHIFEIPRRNIIRLASSAGRPA